MRSLALKYDFFGVMTRFRLDKEGELEGRGEAAPRSLSLPRSCATVISKEHGKDNHGKSE